MFSFIITCYSYIPTLVNSQYIQSVFLTCFTTKAALSPIIAYSVASKQTCPKNTNRALTAGQALCCSMKRRRRHVKSDTVTRSTTYPQHFLSTQKSTVHVLDYSSSTSNALDKASLFNMYKIKSVKIQSVLQESSKVHASCFGHTIKYQQTWNVLILLVFKIQITVWGFWCQ